MNSAMQLQTSTLLRLARHAVGMMILALASPYIHYSEQPITTWIGTWAAPLIIAMLAYGLFALVFTKKAKSAWPKSFLILAWTGLALTVASPYIDQFGKQNQAQRLNEPPAQDAARPRPFTNEEAIDPSTARRDGASSVDLDGKPCSEITEFLRECRR